MTMEAERFGYLMVFGQGTPGPAGLAWEAGLCCVYNASTIVDDIAYTRTALKLVQGAVNVDPARVYTTGWSNGGYSQPHSPVLSRTPHHRYSPLTPPPSPPLSVTERLACEAPELFAGAAADASAVGIRPGGQVGLDSCDRSFGDSALNMLLFHGTADTAVPWTGAFAMGRNTIPGVLEDTARWVRRMDCGARVESYYNDGQRTAHTEGCGGEGLTGW